MCECGAPSLSLPSPSSSPAARRRQRQRRLRALMLMLLRAQARVQCELAAQRRTLWRLASAMAALTARWRPLPPRCLDVEGAVPAGGRATDVSPPQQWHTLHELLLALADGDEHDVCGLYVHRHLVDGAGDLPPSHPLLFGSLSRASLAVLLPCVQRCLSRAAAVLQRARGGWCCCGAAVCACVGATACVLDRLLAYMELATAGEGASLLRRAASRDAAVRARVRFLIVDVCEARDLLTDEARRDCDAAASTSSTPPCDAALVALVVALLGGAAWPPSRVCAADLSRLAERAARLGGALRGVL